MTVWGRYVAMAAGWLACAACASSGAPLHERLAHSQAVLTAARAAHAEAVPLAQLHLKLAQEQLDAAQTLLQAGQSHRASYLIARAEADAALAQALAQEVPARAHVDELMDAQWDLANHQHPDASPEAKLPSGLDDPEPDATALPLDVQP